MASTAVAADKPSMVKLAKYDGPVRKMSKILRDKCIMADPLLGKKLHERLAAQKAAGKIESEQWYQNPLKWLALTGIANPYKTVFNELRIIYENGEAFLEQFVKYKRQVFFGVGTGDTEIGLLYEVCDKIPPATLNIYAIDVQKFYLKLFAQQLLILSERLRHKHHAKSELWFQGYNYLFEDVKRRQLRLHPDFGCQMGDIGIALGNVIGNFENQHEILSQFNRLNTQIVILGVHLAREPREMDYVFKLYRDNVIFNEFARDAYLRAGGDPKRKTEWVIDKKTNAIRAFAGDTELFYSKKYDLDDLDAAMNELGFGKVEFYIHEQSAICIFKRSDHSLVPRGLDV